MVKISDKFKVNKLSEKIVLNKKNTRIKVFRKDKKKMTIDDVREFYDYLKEKDKKNKFEYLIRGRNDFKMSLIKAFKQADIQDYDEDYYNRYGEILDTDYFYIEIYLQETVKIKK
jgi:hypothetical protein